MSDLRLYNIVVKVYAENAKVPGIACNSIEFINGGNRRVLVEGVRINPGEAWQPVQALPMEGDNSQYLLQFDPADTDPYVSVVQKFYVGVNSQ